MKVLHEGQYHKMVQTGEYNRVQESFAHVEMSLGSRISAGLVNYLFTEVVKRLAKKNLSYGETIHYISERMKHLSNQDLLTMWASWRDKTMSKKLYRAMFEAAKELHRGTQEATVLSDFYASVTHLHGIEGLLKDPKRYNK